MSDESDKYDIIVATELKNLQPFTKKKDIINAIAIQFKAQGMKVPRISSEMKRRMKEYYEQYDISDSTIDRALDPEFKRAYKKTEPKSINMTQFTPTSSETIEEKKPIELDASGQPITEEEFRDRRTDEYAEQVHEDTEGPDPLEVDYEVLRKKVVLQGDIITSLRQEIEKMKADTKPKLINLDREVDFIVTRIDFHEMFELYYTPYMKLKKEDPTTAEEFKKKAFFRVKYDTNENKIVKITPDLPEELEYLKSLFNMN